MYRLTIVREGQPIERRTAISGDGLCDAVHGLVGAEGSELTDTDRSRLAELVAAARSVADAEGFGALQVDGTAIAIRPQAPAEEAAGEAAGPELTATLLVGLFTSRCGNCRQPTLVYGVTHHTDVSGYEPKPGGGCGARFVDTAPDHPFVSAARLREMRSDLPVRARS